MKDTSFGAMARLACGRSLAARCEVMHFRRAGEPHTHDVEEIAIAVTGAGTVWIDGVAHHVSPGEFVTIPAGAAHYMEPDPTRVLSMVIAYADGFDGLVSSLFDAIAHGDDDHRAWLKQAIDDHMAGRPVQRGGSS